MAVEIMHSGEAVVIQSSVGTVTAIAPDWAVEAVSGILDGGIPYTGAYEADALFREQVFPTALKTMRQDFLVHAINYTEAPNDSGVTVTIGG